MGHDVYMCSGECRSQSIWSDQNDKFNKQCSCCGVAKTEDVEIELTEVETGATKKNVLDEVQKAGAEIKAELREELGKEEFETVREAVREDVRGLKAKITELFGF